MRQTTKFYLTSFLKNQTYFTPVFVLFLQFHHLDFQEIFWVFTIGSVVSVLVEIPTGVIADFTGKKKSIILAKFLIFSSYILFGVSNIFWMFVLAQVVYELGSSFRSGTETAYTFDFLNQTKGEPPYTLVKGNQKFWARIGEALASAAGGFIAKLLGFNMVFFFAAVPAVLNFLLALTWEDIKEEKQKIMIKNSLSHTRDSVCNICRDRNLLKLTLNIMVFTSVIFASTKFIQPYLVDANIPVEWFGVIYALSLSLAALSGKYSYLLQRRLADADIINYLSALAIIPALILGFHFVSFAGVFLFFSIIVIENVRSPIANTLFHKNVTSRQRSTLGSVLSLFKSTGKILILPLTGFFADVYSMYTALLFTALVLMANALFFKLDSGNK